VFCPYGTVAYPAPQRAEVAWPTNYDVTVHHYAGTGGCLSGDMWDKHVGWIAMGSAGGSKGTTGSNNRG